MGEEITTGRFTQGDFDRYRAQLREETKTLKGWFDAGRFARQETPTIGLELEAWLLDENAQPSPRNGDFLRAMDHPDVVEELASFNVEINAPPQRLEGACFSDTAEALGGLWRRCRDTAAGLDLRMAMCGILPSVRDDMLQPEWMSDFRRYRALNRQLMESRARAPLHIDIRGTDYLDYRCDHIMLEAACTSLQAHLQVNQEDAVAVYNAAVLAAAPLVAATANAPFLYGKSLWCETRIPAFEQATRVDGFRDRHGDNVLRVTLGTDYLRHSFLEPFLENLAYPIILPSHFEDTTRLPHLRLMNGTVWRWVRPILGFDDAHEPHLRIEHRVMPAGPSLVDTVANLALCHGLVLALARHGPPAEEVASFEEARASFYACARDGLMADVTWQGNQVNVQTLLIETLIPAARHALEEVGVAESDLVRFIDDIIAPRIRTGRTGAAWQRSYMDCNPHCFQALTETYLQWQDSGEPVHRWQV